ncbi:nucleoside-diphosphate-sugar epimerase [Acetobacter nitrogenifigens DSM 23921 = NBRC 105050]|uniref:3-beta hydroxysteroid dehydrogenase n=1 Tax=Acetobacter nitrogenifigens DSM 23921 = NBRC 105050 TaxID=1120919 RepID=A0A511XEN3_9PROT|nr:SDR family oxidoreductase [Acetobacter nitrogenifigens]GBQ96614.1 nucleoside-diphosphate-sugar epimerase [Acetobacter nitrogenifigens DSM 23921 = NBRC 105050]GEN61407.1 3-beta hydroxysteroid dehydrogenase [Acetobacter nitrogenifigens DSM 23921 = NBRC 105050]
MKVFVTGATGFIGSSIVDELLRRSHVVVGFARSETSADNLRAKGAQIHRGSIDDPASVLAALASVDGAIHTAFNHDFSTYMQNCADDGALLDAMAETLGGTGKPLIATSSTAVVPPGQIATEDQAASPAIPRGASERFLRFSETGVRTGVIRLPPSVHGKGDTAFVPAAIAAARRTGVSTYVGDGANRWPAVHRNDAARLFCDALERGEPDQRFNAVQDEGVAFRAIAEAIGRGLEAPVRSIPVDEAENQFGWLGRFVMADVLASSRLTRERLGWKPVENDLLADLELSSYFDPSVKALST